MQRVDFKVWVQGQSAGRMRVAAIERGFAQPYRRERARASDKARLLRDRGVPERLIGPESL
jgi:hypothetical protein